MQKLQVFELRSPYVIIPNLNGESKQKLNFLNPLSLPPPTPTLKIAYVIYGWYLMAVSRHEGISAKSKRMATPPESR